MIEFESIILDEISEKFGNECLVLVTGSYTSGNYNQYSDVDLIIASPIIGLAYNEKFISERLNRKVDALIVPKLNIINEIIKSYNSSNGAFVRMLHFGKILKDESEILIKAKETSSLYYLKGKEVEKDLSEIRNRCIVLSNSIEDLNAITERLELYFTITRVINEFTELYLNVNQTWSFAGKQQARNIKKIAPDFAEDIEDILDSVFTKNQVSQDVLTKLKRHLQRFMDFSSSYSTRNTSFVKNEISFTLDNITHSEYFALQQSLSVELNQKFTLYIERISFEYHDILQQVILKINVDISKNISAFDIYQTLKMNLFRKNDTSVHQELKINGMLGGDDMNSVLLNLKYNVSKTLLDYLFENNRSLENSEVLNIGFFLQMQFFKKYFDPNFENYLFDYWLPNCIDVKALRSYEQLAFEKEKLINHYSIRLSQEKEILFSYLDYFLESNDIIEGSSLHKKLVRLSESSINESNEASLYFFDVDTQGVFSYLTDKNVDINSNLAYKAILDAMLNTIGVPYIDRAYFIYVYKKYRNGRVN